MTAEQEARDLLERMGIENAQSFGSGDLAELANLIIAARVSDWEISKKLVRIDELEKQMAANRLVSVAIIGMGIFMLIAYIAILTLI